MFSSYQPSETHMAGLCNDIKDKIQDVLIKIRSSEELFINQCSNLSAQAMFVKNSTEKPEIRFDGMPLDAEYLICLAYRPSDSRDNNPFDNDTFRIVIAPGLNSESVTILNYSPCVYIKNEHFDYSAMKAACADDTNIFTIFYKLRLKQLLELRGLLGLSQSFGIGGSDLFIALKSLLVTAPFQQDNVNSYIYYSNESNDKSCCLAMSYHPSAGINSGNPCIIKIIKEDFMRLRALTTAGTETYNSRRYKLSWDQEIIIAEKLRKNNLSFLNDNFETSDVSKIIATLTTILDQDLIPLQKVIF